MSSIGTARRSADPVHADVGAAAASNGETDWTQHAQPSVARTGG